MAKARYEDLLVIGGPHDGEWRNVIEDLPHLRLPVRTMMVDANPRDISLIAEMTPVADYKLERLHTPKRTYKFFRHVDLSIDDAFDKLFRGYRHD